MATIHQTANVLVGVAMFTSIVLWTRFGLKCARGQAHIEYLVPPEPRERPFWSFGEFLVMFGLL